MTSSLKPVDFIAARITTGDGTDLYGVDGVSVSKIVKWTVATEVLSDIYDFGGSNEVQRVIWYPGVMFAAVDRDGTSKVDLYRSVDSGASWTRVWALGTPPGDGSWPINESTQIASVRLLSQYNICKATLSGLIIFYLGEYSTGAAGTDIVLAKSTDDGATWTQVTTWNGIGEQIRHIHAVQQDPVNGRIFIAFGDSTTARGIVEWDHTGAAPADDTAPGDYDTATVKGVGDSDKWKATNFAFGKDAEGNYTDYIYWTSDSSSASDNPLHGIYRSKRQASIGIADVEIVSQPYNSQQIGYFVINADRQNLLAFDGSGGDTPAKSVAVGVNVSGNGRDFLRVARYNGSTGATNLPIGFLWQNDRLYLSCNGNTLKDVSGTTVCEWGTEYTKHEDGLTDYYEDSINPVIWVATTGTNKLADTQQGGWSPRDPLADPMYALTQADITPGTRVMVAAGNYDAGGARLGMLTSGANPGETGVPVQMTGVAAETTILTWATYSSGNRFLIFTRMANQYIQIDSMWIRVTETHASNEIYRPSHANATAVFRDCFLGIITNTTADFIIGIMANSATTVDLVRTFVMGAGQEVMRFQPTSESTITFRASAILSSSVKHFNFSSGSNANFVLDGCLLDGFTSASVQITNGADFNSKNIRNCVWIGDGGSAKAISDLNGVPITWTLDDIDYCSTDNAGVSSPDIFDLSGHHNIDGEAVLVTSDASTPSVSIASTSALKSAGSYGRSMFDINDKRKFSIKRDIGPVALRSRTRPSSDARADRE